MTTKLVLYCQMLLLIGTGLAARYGFGDSTTFYVACVLLSRSIFLILFAIYGTFFLPDFRSSLLLNALMTLVPGIFWFPALFVTGDTLIAIFWVSNVLDSGAVWLGYSTFWRLVRPKFLLALNIEQ
jgi:hypothetical protein